MQKGIQNGKFVTSDGCALAYSVRGKVGAPRIALIHSLALDASIWDSVAALLASQAEILAFDCRGHGQSGKPVMPFTVELFARDLTELLDHLAWRQTAVAGCSMGGNVAQAFAGLFPARVSALGLIDTTAWYGADAPVKWRERAGNARAKGLAGMLDFQVTRWFSDRFRAAHPERVNALAEVFLGNNLDCYAATCAMLGDADLRPYLSSLRIPAAVIVGEEDYATPIAMARHLHQAIAGSSLTILPQARHLTPAECPEQIAAQLAELLQRTANRAAAAQSSTP